MTRQAERNVQCSECRVDMVCPKCGKTKKTGTDFSNYIRSLKQPGTTSKWLSIQNIDFVVHNYNLDWFILLEEKCYGGTQSTAQKITHGIVHQFLLAVGSHPVDAGYTQKTIRNITCRGYYVITFEKTSPLNSNWMRIDGIAVANGKEHNVNRRISMADLYLLLGAGGVVEVPGSYSDRFHPHLVVPEGTERITQ